MRPFLALILTVIATVAVGCQQAPNIVQGTVVTLDNASETLKIADETAPGAILELSLSGAEIGAAPRKGDTVRVAYEERNGKLTATRVMKVAKEPR